MAELVNFGNANQNVHRQVKGLSTSIRGATERGFQEFKMVDFAISLEKNRQTEEIVTLRKQVEEMKAHKCNLGQQGEVTHCSKCKKEINSIVENLGDEVFEKAERIKSTIEKRWREDAYISTTIEERSQIGKRPDFLAAFLGNHHNGTGTVRSTELQRDFLDRFPEAEEGTLHECPGGSIMVLEEATKFVGEHTGNAEKKRTVCVLYKKEEEDPIMSVCELLLQIKRVATGNVTIIAPT